MTGQALGKGVVRRCCTVSAHYSTKGESVCGT